MHSELQHAIAQHPWIADELKRVGFDAEHLFLEDRTYGELHTFPGVVVGVGSRVPFHFHDFPHMMILYPGDSVEPSRYALHAQRSDGEWIERKISPFGIAYIEAGRPHSLTLTQGRFGLYCCTFATHGPDGKPRLDPKQWTGEACDRLPRPFEAAHV